MELSEQIKSLQTLKVCRRKVRVWEPYMRKYNCDVVAEIGVCKGNNFELFVAHNPTIAIAVDSWINDGVVSRNDRGYSQNELDVQYTNFISKYADKPSVKVYREYSFDAVKRFPDEYFDIVYIDAEHTYGGCLRDIKDWYPKVKRGSVLVGDDYMVATLPWTKIKFGVVEAVQTFIKENNLNFFELPRHGWGIVRI